MPTASPAGTLSPATALQPLRVFLGATFVYAAAQKLYDPAFLDPAAPGSFAAQSAAFRHRSPIGFAMSAAVAHPTLFGLLIAFGELAAGLGTLLGLWTRAAAAGGAALSLTFFLTVSWNTEPYYYGSDVVFAVGWLTLGLAGALPWSLDRWLAARNATAEPGTAAGDGAADPALATTVVLDHSAPGADAADGATAPAVASPDGPARRGLLQKAAATGIAGGAALLGGAGIGALGRARKRSKTAAVATTNPPAAAGTPTPVPRSSAPAGTGIRLADVPAAGAAQLTAANGSPVFVSKAADGTVKACSGICTHAGCPVALDQGRTRLVCPCHGSVFDAASGAVLNGPATDPLPPVAVTVADGVVKLGA